MVICLDGGGQKDTRGPRPKAHRPVYIGDLHKHTDMCRSGHRPAAIHTPQYLVLCTRSQQRVHIISADQARTQHKTQRPLCIVTDVCTQTLSRYTQAQRLGSTPVYTQEQTRVHAAGHPDPYIRQNRHMHPRATESDTQMHAHARHAHALTRSASHLIHTHTQPHRTHRAVGRRTHGHRQDRALPGTRARARTHTHTHTHTYTHTFDRTRGRRRAAAA